ncbi:MAG: alpha/beta fold hydrolase [Deltaproteobacteria bacterium]|nr:alpha/beta fold hydrolase [Deltaproteobacteria bacterium]
MSALDMVGWLVALLFAGTLLFITVTFGAQALSGTRATWKHLLWAALKELLVLFVVTPVWPLFWLLGEVYRSTVEGERTPEERGPPVVLLHGYMMNRTNWIWLGPRLARRGIGPLFGTSYFSPQSLDRSAAHLARFVDDVRAREGVEKVDIIAHSLGGVVARYYVEHLDGASKVRRVVTIATPFRGTIWAWLAFGGARSALLRHEREPGANPGGVPFFSIWSRSDNIVVPSTSSELTSDQGDNADVVFDDIGHGAMLFSPRVADAIADRLRRG